MTEKAPSPDWCELSHGGHVFGLHNEWFDGGMLDYYRCIWCGRIQRMQIVENTWNEAQLELLAEIEKDTRSWFDERIKFAETEKSSDDSKGDALGERYWHGITVAYMGAKQFIIYRLLEVKRKAIEK